MEVLADGRKQGVRIEVEVARRRCCVRLTAVAGRGRGVIDEQRHDGFQTLMLIEAQQRIEQL